MAKFNPSLQAKYCRDVDRAFFGKAPTLRVFEAAYGRIKAELWLEIQLNDLSEFSGCREKLGPTRTPDLAAMIFEGYPHFKLTEFMMFFQRFKRCEYGRFYGAVDPMVILQALSTFAEDRRKLIERKRMEEERERVKAIDREYKLIRKRYGERIPGAYTPEAPSSLLQYRLMGYDCMDDEALHREIDAIRSGKKKLSEDVRQMLDTVSAAFGIRDNE